MEQQAQQQVIEGTSEEIFRMLQGGAFAGHMLRVIVDPDEEDFTETLPDPPNTIRDAAHLEQLLLDGLYSGPPTPMTDSDWEDIRKEVRASAARRACFRTRTGEPGERATSVPELYQSHAQEAK